MTVCSTTALCKYLTQHSNLGQPSREKAVSTTRAHAEGETIINSGRYRRPLFKSSLIGGSMVQCRLAFMAEGEQDDYFYFIVLDREGRAEPLPTLIGEHH